MLDIFKEGFDHAPKGLARFIWDDDRGGLEWIRWDDLLYLLQWDTSVMHELSLLGYWLVFCLQDNLFSWVGLLDIRSESSYDCRLLVIYKSRRC